MFSGDSCACQEASSCASEAGAPERLGVGAYFLHRGPSLVQAGLVHHEEAAPDIVRELVTWAEANQVVTLDDAGWRVKTAPEFVRDVLYRYGYKGRATVVALDPGHAFALLAERCIPGRKARYRGSWAYQLRGAVEYRDGRILDKAHMPRLRVRSSGPVGTSVAWCPKDGPDQGVWVRDEGGRQRPYLGRFVDALGAAYAFDAEATADLARHLSIWGLPPIEAPTRLHVDATGIDAVVEILRATRQLALAIDRSAEGFDISQLRSPGGVGGALLDRMGVAPPHMKFELPGDAGMEQWMAALRGGWVSAEVPPRWTFPAADVDVRSAFPTVADLIGWWELMTAESVREEVVTASVRKLLALPVPELVSILMRPKMWRLFGLTLVTISPDGDLLPVTVARAEGEESERGEHCEMRIVTESDRPIHVHLFEAVASTVLTGHAPHVLSARRIVPVGRQSNLRPVELWDVKLDPDHDPADVLVKLRGALKPTNPRLAALLRVVANGMVWGLPAQFNPTYRNGSNGLETWERPGPWCYPPLAVSVSAGSRLLLALAEHRIDQYGGRVAYRDTDGLMVPCSRNGGTLTAPNGSAIRAISEIELAEVLDSFKPLRDGDDLWSVKHLARADVWSSKRYALYEFSGKSPIVLDSTEHALGGFWAPPTGCTGRIANGHRQWTREAVAGLLAYDLISDRNRAKMPSLSWPIDFPAMRRLRVTRPHLLTQLPTNLGVLPFGTVLDAPGVNSGRSGVVALDPGGELAGWESLDWRERSSGESVQVTTSQLIDSKNFRKVKLNMLRMVIADWGGNPNSRKEWSVPEPIAIHTHMVWVVGRRSGPLDSRAAAPWADLSDQTVYYQSHQERDADALRAALMKSGRGTLTAIAESVGVPGRTLRDIANGARPRASTVARIRDALGSDGPEALASRTLSICARPGCNRHARPRSNTCGEACKKWVQRQRPRPLISRSAKSFIK